MYKEVFTMPKNWIDASFDDVSIYHTKDLAIYVNAIDNVPIKTKCLYEVHNININKSKFSLLLKTNEFSELINFVNER
ncbi:MAG TPA: hypothetical protein DCM40_16030 [Maribacter sp.]|nr:hypothetical protein [Maribacter sp.]|tara:strand:+ start:160 stop:393 length:234 start_codon:yes stop_codon:yes gene_type:complete